MDSSVGNYRKSMVRQAAMALVGVLSVCVLLPGCGDDNGPAGVPTLTFADTVERTFSLDFGPSLDLSLFVGNVTVRPGPSPGLMQITAIKRAASEDDLNRITLSINAIPNGVNIIAANPSNTQNTQVDFEIFAPEIATWNMDVKVGSIDYEGRPKGTCGFSTGFGEIKLKLPQNMNAVLNLSTGAGVINLGFAIDGQVSTNSVMGTIGNGSEAEIAVGTTVGGITVSP
ncbi:MAG: hypothetical protein FVQ81_15750 [Candidatus Glassbacteria bacterium]|nr:hypothetical protein [Candidatus Glassbacteria bacterium]